jgi:toxin HigB-1
LEIVFLDEKLLALYESGLGRPLRLEKAVVESFFDAIAVIATARDICDLWNLPSLHFERLQSAKNRYSIRLDRKWRLEMSIEWKNEAVTVGVIGLEEISKHYGGWQWQ